ncbi:MAG: hypothetical protein WCT04_09825 [Planctomycetota bacterium]
MLLRSSLAFSTVSVLALSIVVSGCGDSAPAAGKGAPSKESSPYAPAMNTPAGSAVTVPGTTGVPSPQVAKIPDGPLQTEIALDPKKYPQDTPEHALESLAKAIESDDLAYWYAWLYTPDRIFTNMQKYKTIEACVKANKTPERTASRVVLLDAIRKTQLNKTSDHGTIKITNVKWHSFISPDGKELMFLQLADGRWCWDASVTTTRK